MVPFYHPSLDAGIFSAVILLRCYRIQAALHMNNEWYPRELQISLHIRSHGLQDYSEVWNLKFLPFWGGVFWNSRIWTLWQFSFGGVFWNSWIWTLWQFSFGGGILKLSDLDSLTIFIWGGILKLLDLDSLTIFILGGYSETFRFGLSDNFHWGVFWNSRIWTLWQFSFWGGILKLSDLDSLTIFIGGYSETLGFGLSDNFHWGGILKLLDMNSLTIFILGGYSETLGFGLSDNFHLGGYSETLLRIPLFWGIWTEISTTPAGSCITDSLSHVETKKCQLRVTNSIIHGHSSTHLAAISGVLLRYVTPHELRGNLMEPAYIQISYIMYHIQSHTMYIRANSTVHIFIGPKQLHYNSQTIWGNISKSNTCCSYFYYKTGL